MALSIASPTPKHRFDVAEEIKAVNRLFTRRKVPRSKPGRLLLATWNIANLGVQGRTDKALQVIAHILKRFDLIAVQEVNDLFKNFLTIVAHMGTAFDFVMTDTAGNSERLAYVYRKRRTKPTRLFGELALRPREYPKRTVKVRWRDEHKQPQVDVFKNHRFVPFDRNPFIGSFVAGNIDFVMANVHLYFGKFQDSKTHELRAKYARRVLEIYALAKWAGGELKKRSTFDRDIILLGDMNVPTMDPEESTYKALVKFGWKPVDFVTRTGGSNLGNDKTYDQMAFAPGSIGNRIVDGGVFDFDKEVFKPLWQRLTANATEKQVIGLFNRHVKHHFSDHRPLWVQLNTE